MDTAAPKILVKPDDIIHIKFWVYTNTSGKIEVSKDRPAQRGAKELIFDFQRPNTIMVGAMKKKCTEFLNQHNIFWTDQDRLNAERVRTLLKDWNLDKIYGKELYIAPTEGKLDDKMMKVVQSLDPIVTAYLYKELEGWMG